MKRYTLFTRPICVGLFIVVFSIAAYPQDRTIEDPDPNQLNFSSSIDVFRFLTGRAVKKDDKSFIDANALLSPAWLKGIVNFKNGQQFRNAELKFDLQWNELYFNKNSVTNKFAEPVSSFYLVDTMNGVSRIAGFKNGYPDFGLRTEKTFYLMLATGPHVHLLKYLAKNKRDVNATYASSQSAWRIAEDIFLYDVKTNQLHIINKMSLRAIEKALPQYAPIIRQWQNENNDKAKHLTTDDFIDLVNMMNYLPVSPS